MRTKVIWFLTAVFVVGSCALTVSRGWDIVRYSMAEARPDALRPWFDVSGVAFAARERALPVVDDLSDAQKTRQRREDITGILSVRPLSSDYWLSLAKMRQATGEGSSKISEALELSTLTGPNEGTVIVHRGLFGVWQWQTLPSEARVQTAVDLTAIRLSDHEAAWLKAELSGKPDVVREEIRTALQAHGLRASEFARIGL
jgi:hypothetical protein